MGRRELKGLIVKTYKGQGDAIAGQQIIAQARSIGNVRVVAGTSTHRIQEAVLRINALCVIDQPFKLVDHALKATDKH